MKSIKNNLSDESFWVERGDLHGWDVQHGIPNHWNTYAIRPLRGIRETNRHNDIMGAVMERARLSVAIKASV